MLSNVRAPTGRPVGPLANFTERELVKRVLVANRGEIALRVIRACHEEGLEAVAVYSEADVLSPHVSAADRAMLLGPAPAAESYLDIAKLLTAAKESGADAVHPGYGFLAERPQFAEAVERMGLAFVGPSHQAIQAMGSKTEARQRMQKAGVPIVPGTTRPVDDPVVASHAAADMGFPVLLKAVAGGGGKGMRKVEAPSDFESAFRQASSEAAKAFGDGSMYLERYIESPRHVEIQILADTHGNVLHVGDRECSVQRRHQKLIEEAPSPAVDAQLRERMGEAAVAAARSVEYSGAGTVEFLLESDGSFYFLEMNTRIQVEHPVTELVYGIDLVRAQLRVAAGEPLGLAEGGLHPTGHAIECRITSEDPFNGFLPDTGRIDQLVIPSGPGVRWDGGIQVGNEIGLHYDALLGKLIVWAEDRRAAIARMERALSELVIVGVATSQPFHRRVLADEGFRQGNYNIRFLEQRGDSLLSSPPCRDELEIAAVAAALAEEQRRAAPPATDGQESGDESLWIRSARRDGLR